MSHQSPTRQMLIALHDALGAPYNRLLAELDALRDQHDASAMDEVITGFQAVARCLCELDRGIDGLDAMRAGHR